MINFVNKKPDLSGYTLLIPSVCVGNVAQLTTDLIISTLTMQKIGVLWDPAIIPIIGPPAFKHDTGITTSSDLYCSQTNKLLILQIRSPLVAGLMSGLFEKLTDFVRREKINRLLIVSGSYAHEKHLIGTTPFEYDCNQFCDVTEKKLLEKSTDWIETDQTSASENNSGGIIHGGGFARKLQQFATRKEIPTFILYKYVSEGDNIPDAIQFTDKLNGFLNILPKFDDGRAIVSHPISWKLLYGNAPPLNVY